MNPNTQRSLNLVERLNSISNELEDAAFEITTSETPLTDLDSFIDELEEQRLALDRMACHPGTLHPELEARDIYFRVVRIAVTALRGLVEVIGPARDDCAPIGADCADPYPSQIRAASQVAYSMMNSAVGPGPMVNLRSGALRVSDCLLRVKSFSFEELDGGAPVRSIHVRNIVASAMLLMDFMKRNLPGIRLWPRRKAKLTSTQNDIVGPTEVTSGGVFPGDGQGQPTVGWQRETYSPVNSVESDAALDLRVAGNLHGKIKPGDDRYTMEYGFISGRKDRITGDYVFVMSRSDDDLPLTVSLPKSVVETIVYGTPTGHTRTFRHHSVVQGRQHPQHAASDWEEVND